MADSKYETGKMDITAQEKTFAGFIKFATNTSIGIIIFLIFLYLVAG